MRAYIAVTFLIPEMASKISDLLLNEGWTMRIAGENLVETDESYLGSIAVFAIDTNRNDTLRIIRDRVKELFLTSEIQFLSLFVTVSDGGANWASSNIPRAGFEVPPLPKKEDPRPSAWDLLENPEL